MPVPVAVAGGRGSLGVLSLASQEGEVVVVELVLDGLLHNVFHLNKSYEQGNVNGSVSPSESIWTSDMCSRLEHLVVNFFLRNISMKSHLFSLSSSSARPCDGSPRKYQDNYYKAE